MFFMTFYLIIHILVTSEPLLQNRFAGKMDGSKAYLIKNSIWRESVYSESELFWTNYTELLGIKSKANR